VIEVYPHEAWCPSCHVSHVPGTKRCLHCGGAVMPMRPVSSMGGGKPTLAHAGGAASGLPDLVATEGDGEGAETPRAARPLRIGVATIWIVLAVVGAILRTCAERG
jgi:hypothetical protein